ncbi:MAG: allantoicase [Parasphingorhabdus sp.]|jgi:allantoicase
MSSQHLINLASKRLGAQTIFSTDDFFAEMSRMIDDAEPIFVAGKYDDNGKWMDGWESRRKRESGHDWCVVKLAARGYVEEIEIDTRHFTGNYAPAASLQVCSSDADNPAEEEWQALLGVQQLRGDNQHVYSVSTPTPITHVRLHIYPDGGVARLRVRGTPDIHWSDLAKDEVVDLAASLNGGVALACNDEHFGVMNNLLAPGRGVNMGDGWETRRRREPGHDWVIVKLGHSGSLQSVEIDTAHFKGNFPDRCSVQGIYMQDAARESLPAQSLYWTELLPEQKLAADTIHSFSLDKATPIVNYIRFNIHPDGGVSRLRLFGVIDG